MAEELTPMLRQYRAMKRELDGDALLLFRLGDFYELFMDDAREAASLLGLALTHRAGQPMCGIPHHALDSYLAKIVRAGRKAAICDQMEDPKSVKGGRMVRREITRIVTPGTVTEETLLADDMPTYIVAAAPVSAPGGGKAAGGGSGGGFVLAALELSTGDFFCERAADSSALAAAAARLRPGEAIVPETEAPSGGGAPEGAAAAAFAEGGVKCITPVDPWLFDAPSGHDALLRHFGTASLDGFGCEGIPALDSAAGALVRRVGGDLRRDLSHVRRVSLRAEAGFMALDPVSAAHLDIFPADSRKGEGASLFETLDATRTPMGARLLRSWLARPLFGVDAVNARLGAVSALVGCRSCLTPLGAALGRVRDLERAIARVSLGRGGARDVASVAAALRAVPDIREALAPAAGEGGLLAEVLADLDPLPDLAADIESVLSDEPPAAISDGGTIRAGFSKDLDALRAVQEGGRAWIADFQASEAARTGIKNLKIRFNRVFGYYIEVTTSQLGLVPADYSRKQTVASGERFTTPALKEREEAVSGAEAKALALEQEIFDGLRARVVARTGEIQSVARAVARLDVLRAFADRALAFGYVRPVVDSSDVIDIRGGRHPVVEQLPGAERFVPNDTLLDGRNRQIVLLTGPNMAGKSTYLRQTALVVLMAQCGSFVPADSARIGLVDRIFTRVGASDDMARGRSTFLVEMQETATILNNATPRSLVVLDEIGRGTSTFDGISIAWAVAEYLHDTPSAKARTLFATHYHELTDLALSKPGIANASVLVRERGDSVVFLRRVVDGPADKSYGIAVAKLAGMPAPVLARARQILANLESNEIDAATGQSPIAAAPRRPAPARVPRADGASQLELGL